GMGFVARSLQAARRVPIVFAIVSDPVGAGFVDSLAKPGGNATGFMTFEPGISAKWLELLKEFVPDMKRTAVLRDPTITAGIGMWGAIQAGGPAPGGGLRPLHVRPPPPVERPRPDLPRHSKPRPIVARKGLARPLPPSAH